MTEKKPMSLAEALKGVAERTHGQGRQPIGAEPMTAVMNVRAMPSQMTRWRRVVATVGYRSMNVFVCDAADLYAGLLEALAPAALAAGKAPRDYVRDACRALIEKEVK